MKTPLLLATLLLGAGPLLAANASGRPNIVLIMTDDQGYGDLGVTGNPVIDTPNIDRLARDAATMSTFYVSPVCSPTRAALMTGRYNYRTRVVDTFKGRSMMEPAETTVAEVLRSAGYATGIFGKWHLGDNYPMRPSDQGFEESLIHRGGGLAQPSEPIENERRYTDPILFRNNEQVRAKGYCTDVFFSSAIEFMEQAAGAQRPFFATITPNAPHGPYHDVPEKLYEKYNLAAQHPEIVRQLQQAYETWFASVSTTRPDNFAAPRIVVGTRHEPRTVLTSQDKRTIEGGWLLRFERGGPYDVELHWKDPAGAVTLEIRIGREARKIEVAAGAVQARIEGWALPAGNAALSVNVTAGPKQREPYHLVLRPAFAIVQSGEDPEKSAAERTKKKSN